MATIRTITIPQSVSPARIVFRGETGKPSVALAANADKRNDTNEMKYVRQIANGPVMRVEAARKPNFRRNTYSVTEMLSGASMMLLASVFPTPVVKRKPARKVKVSA